MQAAKTPQSEPRSSQERVVDIVMNEDEINWKDMIYKLVREDGMDPWNINITHLSERFLKLLESLKRADFRIGGKVILASSLLLKIKSDRLMLDDLQNLDDLLNDVQEPEGEEELPDGDEQSFEFEQSNLDKFLNDEKKIVPRTPQPRERKVSVFDLVEALEQALETDEKKRQQVLRQQQENQGYDEEKGEGKSFDLTEKTETVRKSLKKMFTKKTSRIYFTDLLPSQKSQDMIFTFIPLLHMENQQKVYLDQNEHFGPIEVKVNNKKLLD